MRTGREKTGNHSSHTYTHVHVALILIFTCRITSQLKLHDRKHTHMHIAHSCVSILRLRKCSVQLASFPGLHTKLHVLSRGGGGGGTAFEGGLHVHSLTMQTVLRDLEIVQMHDIARNTVYMCMHVTCTVLHENQSILTLLFSSSSCVLYHHTHTHIHCTYQSCPGLPSMIPTIL